MIKENKDRVKEYLDYFLSFIPTKRWIPDLEIYLSVQNCKDKDRLKIFKIVYRILHSKNWKNKFKFEHNAMGYS